MASEFTLAQRMDRGAVVSGNEALALAILPSGRRLILANFIKFKASLSHSNSKVPILGRRNKTNRRGQGEISVEATAHYNCSTFREIELEHKKNGSDYTFDLQIINNDPGSSVGRQVVILYGVSWDEIPLAMFDAEADYVTEDLSGTADDWDMENVFNENGLKQA
nr:MAG TPA: tail tube protein [Caudoviricetes sp.]